MRRIDGQRGFTFVEVLVATALIASVAVAFGSAVAFALHAQAVAARERVLDDDALGALADLRAMTVYDPAMLARLAGRSASMPLTGALAGETLSVRFDAGRLPGTLQATALAAAGESAAEERASLFAEAPAPGSTVTQ